MQICGARSFNTLACSLFWRWKWGKAKELESNNQPRKLRIGSENFKWKSKIPLEYGLEWFLQHFRLIQGSQLSETVLLFIDGKSRQGWSNVCAWSWVLHAWACTGACEAQDQMQMQAELILKWNGRAFWMVFACAWSFIMNSINGHNCSLLRKSNLKNPNIRIRIMVGKVLA